MTRAFIIVLDSLGVGGAPDASQFGDEGADTLGHIAERCTDGEADQQGTRRGPLHVPHMRALGLGECSRAATHRVPPALELKHWQQGFAGCAAERSTGKDSQSGHWEIAGTPVSFEWGYFPKRQPCFPRELIDALCERGGLDGILGDKHASGTDIIRELGEEHLRTGNPICYTSADSVFQIAAHEERFGLPRLYELCKIARELVDPLRVGRVIARPFIGTSASNFARTSNRHDYGVVPPEKTLLSRAQAARRDVASIGKIGDLFCHTATGHEHVGANNDEVFDRTLDAAKVLSDGGLLFANLVDFDTLYGHRRDTIGYASALESFDARLPEFFECLQPGDLAIITGDHGCDPTWPGSDHTRECIPVLAFGPEVRAQSIGQRTSFADIGATVARHLKLPNGDCGRHFH